MSRIALGLAGVAGLALTGCIVVPLNADGTPAYPVVPQSTPVVVSGAPGPQQIPLRLYPANDVASSTGVIAGYVINHMNGRGTFMLNVGGETMSGEATRSSSDAGRSGVANAYGSRGAFASCRYTMNNSTNGTGSCTFSNGAQYQLHLGS
jgi:hypothetical protein